MIESFLGEVLWLIFTFATGYLVGETLGFGHGSRWGQHIEKTRQEEDELRKQRNACHSPGT